MRPLSIALAAAICLAATALPAQVPDEEAAIPAPAGNGDNVARLKQRVADLESELEELRGRVSRHDDDLQMLAQGVLKNEGSIGDNRNSINNNRDSIAGIRRLAEDNSRKLFDIAVEDPSNPGRYNVDLLGNMQRSPSFRRELRRTTKPRVRIYNNTGVSHYLYINGTRWQVLPNTWSYAPVASGPVAIQQYQNGPPVVLNNWRHDEHGYHVGYDLWNHREIYRGSAPGEGPPGDSPAPRPVVSNRPDSY